MLLIPMIIITTPAMIVKPLKTPPNAAKDCHIVSLCPNLRIITTSNNIKDIVAETKPIFLMDMAT